MYYSSSTANDVYSSSSRGRESGETMMGPENKSTKHVKHPEQRTHSDHPRTDPPTDPTHQPTDPTTDRLTNLPTHDVVQQYSRVQQQQQMR